MLKKKRMLKNFKNLIYLSNEKEDLKIRMIKERLSYKSYMYKICVVNCRNKPIEYIGYLNPNKILFNSRDMTSLLAATNSKKMFAEFVGIKRLRAIFWLSKGAKPTISVFSLFYVFGLIKLNSVNNSIEAKKYLKFNNKNIDLVELFSKRTGCVKL